MKVNDYNKETGEIDGSHYEDDLFAFQKGLSKAQRNALIPCIPADYAVKMIDRFLRAGGKQPLLSAPRRKGQSHKPSQIQTPGQPPKSKIKPREEWDKITKDQVTDYPVLERIFWELCKQQPVDMYRELGGGTRNDMTTLAWDSFLILKERFAPLSPPDSENISGESK